MSAEKDAWVFVHFPSSGKRLPLLMVDTSELPDVDVKYMALMLMPISDAVV